MRWEVSLIRQGDRASRYVVAADITTSDLGDIVTSALQASHPIGGGSVAVLVQRMDRTPEARLAKWNSEFYTPILYKDPSRKPGKRRKYPVPLIEKQWMEWVVKERRASTAARRQENDSYRKATDGS